MILTEVHLLESRVYRGIGNLAKSKVNAFFLPLYDQPLICMFDIGCSYLSSNSCQLDLLPTTSPSNA